MTPRCRCGHYGDEHASETPFECLSCDCAGFVDQDAAPE